MPKTTAPINREKQPSSDILQNIKALAASRKSLLISSLNEQQCPEISATPFFEKDTIFYVFISELASHTHNLKLNPKVSIMLIEDEQDTKNPFARKRLSYECIASIIDRDRPEWPSLMVDFEEQQGKTISLLKSLPDFHLFELKAISGTYIEGFGKAYRLIGDGLKQVELQTGK